MGHDHHHHDHHHAPKEYGKVFMWAIFFNLIYIGFEVSFGLWTNSMALLADAGHNFSDVVSLILAWIAIVLGKKQANLTYTYGYKKLSILTALTNAIILMLAASFIAWEAVERFNNPREIPGIFISVVATIGIVINGITALLFMDGNKDANIRGAFLHMVADALVSFGVVIGGLAIYYLQWYWIDPLISLFIVVIIFYTTWGLFCEVFKLSMDGVPQQINIEKVKQYLENSAPNVISIHDLHIWALSTTEIALTAHIILTEIPNNNIFLTNLKEQLHHEFEINHITIQLEKNEERNSCPQHC